MSTPKPVVLCILDGWGLSTSEVGNAPLLARTPNFDALMARCPSATLVTHGLDVGLPEGQMGNSEVGHLNIGAGRIVEMDLRRIDRAIENGTFRALPGLRRFIDAMLASKGTAHLLGVLSDGGVHSHIQHMIATAHALTAEGVPVAIHAFTDGRDVAQISAKSYLDSLQEALPQGAYVATVSGRYYAMDRDNRWERVALAYQAIALAQGYAAQTAGEAIDNAYGKGRTDEFIKPRVLGDYAGMADGDGLLCLNFRADRAREILAAFADPDFADFETGPRPRFAIVSGFTEYSARHKDYMDCIFPDEMPENTLGVWVAKHGLTQFHIAETEKYPHVTFFLNGGRESPEPGEDRYMAPSPRVATYDLQPEMSAGEVTDHLTRAIAARYDLIVVNYANPDMVGHTGDLDAAIAACEAVDAGLGRVRAALEAAGGAMLVTADHGNCEVMIDPLTGDPHTAHTTNLVPAILVGGPVGAALASGRLSDVAPTLLALMGLDAPPEMTGRSLLIAAGPA
ncbi:2,3-bisphosphoglycerate-independent phosphoglycerate mutase [Pelagivirga sediminicola]|uniref:2,3-bisphosphoglycerate-independent phosphoglycerate mutase n=1 Tax=Pelagivirga sediminicola TaxID=2170575 RepID=A0A2T7G7M0_9RHOB|nr:2,3-bisphosphoglycerate-independent phosphoglycerate mutase [Pelagivirga sediminicola]PVA10420.1 2,3-bisphosphoglycerate-independent phosphoglycerate mutase [Pelagivirga sediminicola]